MRIQNILYYNLSVPDLLVRLKTEESGLSDKGAEKRLKKGGLNELPKDKRLSGLKIFLRQFNNVLIYILIIAAFFSLGLKEWLDFSIIAAAVLINVIVGFIQENKAEKSLAKLRGVIILKSKVLREGRVRVVSAQELVVGDIILLEAGDQVPADARLIEINNLQTSEAVLTGESTPVIKETRKLSKNEKHKILVAEQKNMIFKGTLIAEGRGRAVITATGIDTELGKIAGLLKTTQEEPTPLQKRLNSFSKKLGLAVLVLAVFIVVIGLIRGQEFWEIFLVGVAVAVSAIPEGLLVAITVILVIGMQRILKKKALVRKLVAAETLGSSTIVCVDKTGTLTEGIMRVEKLVSFNSELDLTKEKKQALPLEIKKLLEYTSLCNNAVIENPEANQEDWKLVGSPTEKAILLAAKKFGIEIDKLRKENPRTKEIPFDSFNKMMTTLHDFKGQVLEVKKGAPEIILQLCGHYQAGEESTALSSEQRKRIDAVFVKYSNKGYRLLASCYRVKGKENKENGDNFIFLGFFVVRDPIRSSVKETIKLAKLAGLRTVMITGDHKLTAKAIAQEIGLDVSEESTMAGDELDNLSEKELIRKVKQITVYARVTPEHKLRIVSAWQAHGEVVAMTGDGVNDAPALKIADIGIAVGSASDVTKETADMVLLDSNFTVILEAIKQGRIIYQNIKKVVVYLLADAFNEVVLIVGTLIVGLPLPLTAAQILWINIITDGFPSAALTFEKGSDNVMQEKPQPKNKPILDHEMKTIIFIIGITVSLIVFAIFWYLYKQDLFLIEYLRTIAFAAVGIDSLLYVFSCKSLNHSVLKINLLGNKFLLFSVGIGFIFLFLPIYAPSLRKLFGFSFLGLWEWILIFSLGILKLVLIEFAKYFFTIRKIKKDHLAQVRGGQAKIWNY